jgi:hypothetical protein
MDFCFSYTLNTLQRHYGAPAPLPSIDPLGLIIWENIAYLASDKRRAKSGLMEHQTHLATVSNPSWPVKMFYMRRWREVH